MRLPWWPICFDVRFDEHGVYYKNADDHEQLLPWHQLRFFVQQRHLVFIPEDEQGIRIKHDRARISFRLNRRDHPDAVEQATLFQKAYLDDPQNQYACLVKSRNDVWDQCFVLAMLIVPSFVGLFMMYQGYQNAPENEPGIRYQNGILISMAALIFMASLIFGWMLNGIRRSYKSSRITEINQDGIVTMDSSFKWKDIEQIVPHFANCLVTTHAGKKLILPNNSCASWILRNRITHPPVLSRVFFAICLMGSMLSGPIFSAWFGYLAPEYEQPFGFWGVSAILTGAVLIIWGAVHFMIWQEKRSTSKSQ